MTSKDGTALGGARQGSAWPLARRLLVRRLLAVLVPALVVALPPLLWVVDATRRASLTTLGRDQGIFQYVAWAVAHGARDYRDVRDVNGPLTHLVHLAFLGLGGADEHVFRVLDLTLTGATFALVGACLPGLGRTLRPERERPWGRVRPERVVERLGWGFAAAVVLGGQYLGYTFWDIAQRESFFDWFLLSSAGLQLVAQGRLRREGDVLGRRLLLVAGALAIVPCFGKPTFVLFTLAQVFALVVDDELRLSVRARLRPFALGALLGAATQVAYLVRYADIGAFFRIYLVDVPTAYRFMWPRAAVEIFSFQGVSTMAAMAFATSAALASLVIERQMPRRALVIVLFPLVGLASAVVQAKGFPYHFHPVSAGLHLQWLALVVWLWERTPRAPRASRGNARSLARLAPLAASVALAVRVAYAMLVSPHTTNLWILTKARDAVERASHDYLVYFQSYDFFPWEMRQAAAYLKTHTRPGERVQTYGMDPYVLFLAERASATPYIYAYDLNADAALAGGVLPEPAGLHPTPAQQAKIVALRDEHERDMLARLRAEPPAAFVFIDKSPLISLPSAVDDFHQACSDSAAWVDGRYQETAVFDVFHVWMRKDLATRGP